MRFHLGKEIFLSSKVSGPLLGPIQPPIQWVPKALPRRQVAKVINTDDFGRVDKQYWSTYLQDTLPEVLHNTSMALLQTGIYFYDLLFVTLVILLIFASTSSSGFRSWVQYISPLHSMEQSPS